MVARPKKEEIIPEAIAGQKCFFCVNIHQQPLINGAGTCILIAYKNGKEWILICPSCAKVAAQGIIDSPLSGGGRKSQAKTDSRYVQERLL